MTHQRSKGHKGAGLGLVPVREPEKLPDGSRRIFLPRKLADKIRQRAASRGQTVDAYITERLDIEEKAGKATQGLH